MIVFKGELLEVVLVEIGCYIFVCFNILDESLCKWCVVGYFKVGDIDGLLFVFKSSFNINYEKVIEISIEFKLVKS